MWARQRQRDRELSERLLYVRIEHGHIVANIGAWLGSEKGEKALESIANVRITQKAKL